MRDTIDFGIDLGTTNSAIAVVEDGEVRVVKNNDGWDTTPSAVWVQNADTEHVGRRARDRRRRRPGDVAMEFKLEMGLAGAERRFDGAGLTRTPPQLSAAVLRSLRGDVRHQFGAPPAAAVITVPASFALNQTDATREAAVLAGFEAPCPLVQEPTAAAFAWGFHDAAERASWLVFDLGGGTFDAAVVSKRDGELQVFNHAGDPYLGGKLIDWAVLEKLLAPAVAAEFGLADFRRDNPAWNVAFAILKDAAEEAKIALSRQESFEIVVDLPVGRDVEEPFTHTLTRGALDAVAEPFYVRAINRARGALTEGGITADRVDRVLLVGGATLAPGLRERLRDPRHGLGIALDHGQDPSTVVARGAALFAGTVRLERPLPPPTAGRFTAELSYEPTVSLPSTTVAGRLHAASPVDWTSYTVTVHNPDGRPAFHGSPQRLGPTGTFATEIPVGQDGASRFTLELLDGAGNRQQLTPDTFSVTYHPVEFGGARLTHSLGIRLADRAFAPLLRKGSTLPAHGREVFRTTGALRRGQQGALLRIPVVEGESARGDRNRLVGMLEIRPAQVGMDLPANSDVEVTFEVDASRIVTVVADVPLAAEQFDAKIDLRTVQPPTAEELESGLADAERRLTVLRAASERSGVPAARHGLDRLDEERTVVTGRETVATARVDLGAAAAADDLLRGLHAALDDIEDATTLPELVAELQARLDDIAGLVAHAGNPADRTELDTLRRLVAARPTAGDVATLRKLEERCTDLYLALERRLPDWPLRLFYRLRSVVHHMQPAQRADELVREGERAVAAGDAAALTGVNQRLIRLLPQDEREVVELERG